MTTHFPYSHAMNMDKTLNFLPLLRAWGLPANIGAGCLIAMRQDLPNLGPYLESRPGLNINRVMLVDRAEDDPPAILVENRGKIPLGGLEDIGFLPQYAKIFILPPPWILSRLCQRLTMLGLEQIWLDGPLPVPFGLRNPLPDFYRRHQRQLSTVYNFLETDEDRRVYAARVKAIMTGNAGYLPIGPHAEYEHPIVRPAAGDVMIDGGVSDMVGAQAQFARLVGAKGAVFGFEPVPWMAESAAAQLKQFPWYDLQCAGLADREGTARFASLRDSSHIVADDAKNADTVECRLTTIDDFVQSRGISRVDCIKLDIEGAELAALTGAAKVISKFRPKLIICLYHRPEDMITIPLFIKNLEPRYRMHIVHSSCDFTDTILYAHIPEKE